MDLGMAHSLVDWLKGHIRHIERIQKQEPLEDSAHKQVDDQSENSQ